MRSHERLVGAMLTLPQPQTRLDRLFEKVEPLAQRRER